MLLALALSTFLTQSDGGLRSPDGGLPPIGLTCLPTWYAGTVKWKPDAGWGLDLENGVFLTWSSNTTVDPDDPESEDVPDLEDIFDPPYVSGPIVPIDHPKRTLLQVRSIRFGRCSHGM